MAATGSVADLDRGAVPPIRVLAVDDHPMYRAGLTAVLSLHADLELVAEAGDGARAVELFRTHRPDVTLMDLRMPVMGGAEAIETITAEFPDAKIMNVSGGPSLQNGIPWLVVRLPGGSTYLQIVGLPAGRVG